MGNPQFRTNLNINTNIKIQLTSVRTKAQKKALYTLKISIVIKLFLLPLKAKLNL